MPIGYLRPGQAILLHGLLPSGRLFIDRDAQDCEARALVAKALIGGEHVRIPGPAGLAPRSPEIDQYVAAPLAGVKNEVVLLAFGQHLRRLREARGWSLQALADGADVSKPTIYRIEKARHSVTLDVLVSLAQALDVPLAELVSFTGPAPARG